MTVVLLPPPDAAMAITAIKTTSARMRMSVVF